MMITPSNIEAMFNKILESFSALSESIDGINKVIENIGIKFTESMHAVSEEIENLSKTLQFILKVDDLENVKKSIHQIVDTFRKELDANKLQKLTNDLTQTVKYIKEMRKAQMIEEETSIKILDEGEEM